MASRPDILAAGCYFRQFPKSPERHFSLGDPKLLEYHAVPVPHDFMKRKLLPICPSSSAMHCTAGANRNAVHICNLGLCMTVLDCQSWHALCLAGHL